MLLVNNKILTKGNYFIKKILNIFLIAILGISVFASCTKKGDQKKIDEQKTIPKDEQQEPTTPNEETPLTVNDYLAFLDVNTYSSEINEYEENNITTTRKFVVIDSLICYLNTESPSNDEYNEIYNKFQENSNDVISYTRDNKESKYSINMSLVNDDNKSPSIRELLTDNDSNIKPSLFKIEDGNCIYKEYTKDSQKIVKISINKQGVIYIDLLTPEEVLAYHITINTGKQLVTYPSEDQIAFTVEDYLAFLNMTSFILEDRQHKVIYIDSHICYYITKEGNYREYYLLENSNVKIKYERNNPNAKFSKKEDDSVLEVYENATKFIKASVGLSDSDIAKNLFKLESENCILEINKENLRCKITINKQGKITIEYSEDEGEIQTFTIKLFDGPFAYPTQDQIETES